MEEDRKRWNERYATPGYLLGVNPSPFLVEQISLLLRICPGRTALDIACGEGRNSVFLARHGFTVTGIDLSDRGLAKARALAEREGAAIDFVEADLETCRISGSYDLVLNFNFLLRPLIPHLVAALNPAGIMMFDTILRAPGAPVPHARDHLLEPGELVTIFSRFDGAVILSEEKVSGEIPTARLIFQRTGRNDAE